MRNFDIHCIVWVFFQIKLDTTCIIDKTATSGYDESNSLVLPSKKRKTEKKKEVVHHVKKLSKKERKELEKVLETRKKKNKVWIIQ